MPKKRPLRSNIKKFTGAIGPEDGIDPRDLARSGRKPSARGRKTLQLCNQIFETLEQVFAEQQNELLQGLHVVSVVPAPDDTNVLVTVSPGPGISLEEAASLIDHLQAAGKDLRQEVAAAITRRKVPAISWRIE